MVPGSPVDVWVAESYAHFHSKFQLREEYGIRKDDVAIVLIGSSLTYDDAPWDYAAVLHLIASQLTEFSFFPLSGGVVPGYISVREFDERNREIRGIAPHFSVLNQKNRFSD